MRSSSPMPISNRPMDSIVIEKMIYMKIANIVSVLFSIAGVMGFSANAVRAISEPIEIKQKDGTSISLIARGDEKGFTAFTTDGIPVVKNAVGIYEYADPNNGFSPSGVKAVSKEIRSAHNKEWLSANSYPAKIPMLKRTVRKVSVNDKNGYLRISNYPTIGRPKALVVLVEFADCSFSTMDDAYSYYDGMLNQHGFTYKNGANGSARDFYNYSSAGLFDPEFVVVGPVKLSKTVADYGADIDDKLDPNAWQMVTEACMAIDSEINFEDFDTDNDGYVDSIYFFYAGFGEADSLKGDAIWPHNGLLKDNWGVDLQLDGKIINNYACSNEIRFNSAPLWLPVGIGTFVHEFGHVLGLADHYDTKYSSGRTGVEDWDTMAAASYNANQNIPPAFSAYERAALGWMQLQSVGCDTPGILTVAPLTDMDPKALKVEVEGSEGREFFVIERRDNVEWDSTLPSHGCLVWRIAEDPILWSSNTINTDPVDQHVDIIEADESENKGSYYGDVFPGASKVKMFDFYSLAGEKVFGFDCVEQQEDVTRIIFGGTSFCPATPIIELKEVHGSQFSFTWKPQEDALGYILNIEDSEGKPLPGFYNVSYASPDTIHVCDLTPMAEYIVTLQAVAGSYKSESSSVDVLTGEIEFFESRPSNVSATQSEDGTVFAQWDELAGANDYEVSIYELVSVDAQRITYGFENGIEDMPEGWTTSAIKISKSMFGKKSPSLQLTEDGQIIEFDYDDSDILCLELFHKSQVESNRLSIEAFDEAEVMVSEKYIDASSQGEIYECSFPENTRKVVVTFLRSSGYMIVDDMSIDLSRHEFSPIESYSALSTDGKPYIVLEDLPSMDNYYFNVRGRRGSEYSLFSEMVEIARRAADGVIGNICIRECNQYYDLSGRMISPDALGKGIYIVKKAGKVSKYVNK